MGQKIYLLRKKRGYSQEELGEMIGVSRQSISKWELDEAIPSAEHISLLCDLFSINTNYFLKAKENTHIKEYDRDIDNAAEIGMTEIAASISKKKTRIKIIISLTVCAVIMAAFTTIVGIVVFQKDPNSLETINATHFTNFGIVVFIALAVIMMAITSFLIYNLVKIKK